MSLINDALKQAKQTQQQNPPPTPPLQFQPVEPEQPKSARAPLLFVGLALGLIVVVALGGLFVWFVSQKSAAELHVSARTANETAKAVTADSPVEPSSTHARATVPPPAPVGLGTNALTATATVEPTVSPTPKIQGIAFHETHPTAILNGKTVVIGDRVGGFRVLAITRNSVTVGSDTATNVLSLSE